MKNQSELFQCLVHMTEDQRSGSFHLPMGQRIFFVSLFTLTIVWGSTVKFFLYKNLLAEKLSERPINVLIFLDQVVEHITKFAIALYAIVKLCTAWNFATMVRYILGIGLDDRTLCSGFNIFMNFMLSYASIGGLGISVYRIMYLKATSWVTTTVGETLVLLLIGGGGQGLAGLLSFISGARRGAVGSATFNGCLGHTSQFEEVYVTYQGQELVYETLFMKFLHPLLFTFHISELICYMVLFRGLLKHDDEMMSIKLISADSHRRRKRLNLFSIYAHVSGFVVETVYLTAVIILRLLGRKYFPQHSRDYTDSVYITQFGLTSTLQILVTPDLRDKLLAMLDR